MASFFFDLALDCICLRSKSHLPENMKKKVTRHVNKSFTLAELHVFQDKIEEKLEKFWYNGNSINNINSTL